MTTAYISHAACQLHEMGAGHPESPSRLTAVDDALQTAGLMSVLRRLDAPPADRDDLERVHRPAYVDFIYRNAPLEGRLQLDPDTAMNAHSLEAARRAAGAGVRAVDELAAGRAANAFCAVRPCGHHATRDRSMGFCIFNNVAVAAAYALHAKIAARVAIIDFDVHHGNGTEDIFSPAPWQNDVVMASFFQHPFYPNSGTGRAAPNMVNVPLAAGSGGEEVRAAVEREWLPALERFKPDMVFISAGFDAHREDPLGGMRLLEADYVWLTRCLMQLAARHSRGRIVSMLEGGYSLSALGRSAAAHVRTLAEDGT